MMNAFLYYGGVPEEILTDNMKTVILGREDGKPVWNPQFEAFALDRGEVHEYILAVLTCDETVALFSVEPLDSSLVHCVTSIKK